MSLSGCPLAQDVCAKTSSHKDFMCERCTGVPAARGSRRGKYRRLDVQLQRCTCLRAYLLARVFSYIRAQSPLASCPHCASLSADSKATCVRFLADLRQRKPHCHSPASCDPSRGLHTLAQVSLPARGLLVWLGLTCQLRSTVLAESVPFSHCTHGKYGQHQIPEEVKSGRSGEM